MPVRDGAAENESRAMNPVEKAIWYIESHSEDEICLDDIATVVGVSSFHLVRAFGAVTGMSVMRYVRARRLSEAAKLLAPVLDRKSVV